MKLITFFISKIKQTLTVRKSTFEIKAMLAQIHMRFCLPQQLFANKGFCTKTRLSNIFKTTNTKTLRSFQKARKGFYKDHESRCNGNLV